MSQQQPQRTQWDQDPINYGDVFPVHGDLATKPIAPRDAAAMQALENQALGEIRRGGPASVMQSAANVNVSAGLLNPDEAIDTSNTEMSVSERLVGGHRIITERVDGQVVGQYVEPEVPKSTPGAASNPDAAITIGEALEASAVSSAGGKPVDQADAAAIQAAEMRATGMSEVLPGGLGAQAHSAASRNPKATRDEEKTTIADVLADALLELPSDKPVTGEDARGVVEAEIRNKPNSRPSPGGVARAMAAAARMNRTE